MASLAKTEANSTEKSTEEVASASTGGQSTADAEPEISLGIGAATLQAYKVSLLDWARKKMEKWDNDAAFRKRHAKNHRLLPRH